MIGDLGAGQPRHNTMQPGLNGIVIAPGHRDEAERRVDGEALADGMFAVCAVTDSVDSGQMPATDLRHRAAGAEGVVQEAQCSAPAVEQRELRPQTVDQREQAAAQEKRRSSRRVTHAPRPSSANTRAHVEVLIPQIFASSADVRPSGESASAASTSITRPVGGSSATGQPPILIGCAGTSRRRAGGSRHDLPAG